MGCNFGDIDHDGFLDFYLGTGDTLYESLMPNQMYHNRQGEGFANITTAAGLGHLQKGHGVAFADFDQDGDQDLFVELGGAFPGDGFANALFENPGNGNHWITIRLIGNQSNRSAIGARIRIEIESEDTQPGRSIFRWVNSGGSFGANPLRQQIGLGNAKKIRELEIYWPATDSTQRFYDIPIDQSIVVTEGRQEFQITKFAAIPFRRTNNRGTSIVEKSNQ